MLIIRILFLIEKNGLNPYTIPISAIINNVSLAELKDIDSTDIGNGKTLVYDGATGKHKYVGSTGTDELVKMDSTGDAHYLADLLDKQTIINDNGILKVKKLDGQEVTITEINYLKGLTMNVMDLVNAFANGGVKVLNTPLNTASELTTMDRSAFIDGISYIVYVLADETHSNAKTTYLVDKTNTAFFGNADSQRNFTTNPIDLANEVTGKLDNSHIDVDSLWSLLTIDDTYKTLTTTNEPFGTHGAKAMYDELITDIGNKANKNDFDIHKNDTTIHITSDERTKWNNAINEEKVKEIVDSKIPTKVSELTNDSNFITGKMCMPVVLDICYNQTKSIDISNVDMGLYLVVANDLTTRWTYWYVGILAKYNNSNMSLTKIVNSNMSVELVDTKLTTSSECLYGLKLFKIGYHLY